MVQIIIFFSYIGIIALIFSQTESLTYVDGLYYMVVTVLTIGFGDITPHTAAMKVLTFPFTIIGISLLAVIVTSIVRLLADRARRRKVQLKQMLKEKTSEKKRKAAQVPGRLQRSLTLQDQLQKLTDDEWKRQTRADLRRIGIGLATFFVFWFVGAVIFDLIEVLLSGLLTLVMGIWKCSLLLLHVCLAIQAADPDFS